MKDIYIGSVVYENLSIEEKFNFLCNELKSLCLQFPTCTGCPRTKDHIGCTLREKSPRDIKL